MAPKKRSSSPAPKDKADTAVSGDPPKVDKSGGNMAIIIMVAALALICGGGALVGKERMQGAMEAAIMWVESQGDNAMYAYLAFNIFAILTPTPSTTPMEFAGGFLFSPRYGMINTWLLTCASKFVANFISIILARYVVKDWVTRNLVQKYEILRMVSNAVKDEPFKMAFLVRGSVAPLFVKNYGLGVLDIGCVPIMLTSCIFTPFYAFQNIYIGSLCQDIKEVFSPKKKGAGSMGYVDIIKTGLPVVLNVLLIYFLVKAVKNQIKKAKTEMEENLKKTPDAKKQK
eukprot:gnl/TRDRNA2_/TRDRNA2_158203_c0_seq3.p1 gnl/TRDRNA2_/TRDRNA2_158203_c0~~gnl/TRDRNA2_/TRDRNA2_158203_c0_seq3.p1  ORF type:complete len:286 (+),score=62.98 gnl/TRDRNA2_/TRDRNA2_158203_c0_seq3:27-884(+)